MAATFLLAYVANSYGFKYVLSVVSSSICWLKRQTSSVEAGFKTTYIRRRGKTRQVPSKNKKIEKQTDKQVGVEAIDNRRNTTDVPTNVMFPACGNDIVLLGKKL